MAADDPANWLANALRRHQVRILRVIQSINGTVQRRLTGVRADLVKLAAAGDPTEPSRLGDQLNRVDAITVDAKKLAAKEYGAISRDTAAATTDAVVTDQSIVAQIVQRTAGVEAIQVLPARVLDRIVDRALIKGAPSADWWRGQAADVAARFEREVREGVQGGQSIGEIITRVRAVMDTPQRNAEALVRSSVLSAQHDVRMEEFRQNADVIQGWAILTTFDTRTCEICMALSGAAFDLDGDPLPGSPYQERLTSDGLPIHFSCRCVAVPVLIGEGIPDDLAFEQWLRTQSVPHQKEILGEQWWTAWQSGLLPSLRDRIDQRGRPITLKALRAAEERKAA